MWKGSWISLWFLHSDRQVGPWVLSLLPYHLWGGWSPQRLLMTETIRLTGEPFGSHFKLLDLFQPHVVIPLNPTAPRSEVP